ncbi:uncharacterized protein LOC143248158 [Tachypleus tridentatus]|uniref:uncharacterized protein LOC143248158 n=1 Tax=Tachypleus tridentatus TaxID=6853 RepID=UPI003FD00E6E
MPLQTIIFSSLLAWLTISFGQQPVMGSAIKTKPVILAAAPRSVKKGLLMNLECKPELVSHYHYQGKTLLWGQQTNHILISAELYVRCLGHDTEGQYNDTALLYLMELRNVSSKVSEKNGIMEDQDTVEDNEKTENLFADYEVPFEIVQFVDGTVPEIRFSDEEQDDTSKNFKRHLSTIFSTKMNKNKHQDKEVSEFGVHKTKYSKETIIQDASSGPPIVRVHKSFTTDDVVELSGADGDFNDISDVDVRSDSDQHFSDGELISSDGHTVISVYHRPNGDERRRRRRYVDDVDGNDLSLEDLYTADMDYKLELQEKKPYIQEPDFVVSKAEVRKFHAASLISETSRGSELMQPYFPTLLSSINC